MIQFFIAPVDYDCLLKHVNRSTSAFPPLLYAVFEVRTTTWLVTCRPLDGIRILQLAHKFCPDAADAIRTGIQKSCSAAVRFLDHD